MDSVNPFTDIFPPCFDDIIAPIVIYAACGKLQSLTQFVKFAKRTYNLEGNRRILVWCHWIATMQLVSRKFYRMFQDAMRTVAASIEIRIELEPRYRSTGYYLNFLRQASCCDVNGTIGGFASLLKKCRKNMKAIGRVRMCDTRDVYYRCGPRGIEIYSANCNGFELEYRHNVQFTEYTIKKDGNVSLSLKHTHRDDVYEYINQTENCSKYKTVKGDIVGCWIYDQGISMTYHVVKGKSATVDKDEFRIAEATPTTLNTFYWPSGKKEIVANEEQVQKFGEDGTLLVHCRKSELIDNPSIKTRISALGSSVSLFSKDYLKAINWK